MLIPYKDINPTNRFAIITFLIIIINIVIFIYQLFNDSGFVGFYRQFALIPHELHNGNLPESNWISPYLSIITYMFIHGSIQHLAFNMLFLWIFGNNIEDVMSRFGFLFFYILTGIISGIAFEVMNPGSKLFLVGASGAISGVLGAYLFLFPFARIHAILFIIPIRMPAIIFLIIWFALQIFGFKEQDGNIAWISHITGFITGIILYKFFLVRKKKVRS